MSDQTTIQALTRLAFNGGDYEATALALQEEGVEVSPGDLLLLQQQNPEQYGRLREQVQKGYEAEVVRQMLDRVREATEVERLLLERTREAVMDPEKPMSGKDAAAAAYSISRVKVGNADKMTSMSRMASSDVDDASVEAALRAMERVGFIKLRAPQVADEPEPEPDDDEEPELR